MDQASLMGAALAAARAAAALVLDGHRSHPTTRAKSSATDLVTDYDLRSERLIRDALGDTKLPIVGEEEGGESHQGPTWYIDPIDGTTNFAHGHFMFCISIGLLDHGVPIVGAVVAPALQTAWYGCAEQGAFRNGAPCHVSQTECLSDSLIATGFAPIAIGKEPHENLARFSRVLPHARGIRRDGSAALDLCMTADGTFDAYWESSLHPWDIMGGAAIALASGATITGFGGGPADFLSGDVVVSNGRVHQELLSRLQ